MRDAHANCHSVPEMWTRHLFSLWRSEVQKWFTAYLLVLSILLAICESHAFRYFTVTLDLFTMAVRPLNENALNIWSEFIPILGRMGFPERGILPGIACQQILIKDEISRVNLKESAHEIMFLVSITPPISIRENASAEKKKEKYGEKRGISFTSKIE